MRKTVGVKMLIVAALICFLLGSTLSFGSELSSRGITTSTNKAEGPVALASGLQGLSDFVSLAKQLSPAVVNVCDPLHLDCIKLGR